MTTTAPSSSTRSSAWRRAGSSSPPPSRWRSASASCRCARPASCRAPPTRCRYALEYGEATLEVHQDAIAAGRARPARRRRAGDRRHRRRDAPARRGLRRRRDRRRGADGAVVPRAALGHRRPPDRHAAHDLTTSAPAPRGVDSTSSLRLGPSGRGREAPAQDAKAPLDRARHACPPGPDRHPPAVVQPGPRAAVPRRARQPPEGRPGAARARLRDRRASARRPDAQERRPLHHPPARRHDDPRRHRHDRADAGRGAAARHGRGHAVHARRSCAPTSATRSRCSSTASPSSTRSSTATRPRPRRSAR